MKLRVLSLWQPWATLWLSDLKIGETRHFRNIFTGLIVVHATKYVDHTLCKEPLFASALHQLGFESSKELPSGAAIGTCNLLPGKRVEEVRNNTTEMDFEFGNFMDGRWWWPATNKEAFAQPIPLKGQQSVPWIWEVPAELEAMFDLVPGTPLPLFNTMHEAMKGG
jgi:hypothetical protein